MQIADRPGDDNQNPYRRVIVRATTTARDIGRHAAALKLEIQKLGRPPQRQHAQGGDRARDNSPGGGG